MRSFGIFYLNNVGSYLNKRIAKNPNLKDLILLFYRNSLLLLPYKKKTTVRKKAKPYILPPPFTTSWN